MKFSAGPSISRQIALKAMSMRILIAAAGLILAATAAADPLAWLAPCVALSSREHRALAYGEVVSRTLKAHGDQVAVFAATRINADAAALIKAARRIADLKQSSFVVATRRFSNPPVLSDLDDLVLSDRDVAALAACELNRCSFKLTAEEIAAVRAARGAGGANRDVLQRALRRILLDRATIYLNGGLTSVPPIVNRGDPWQLAQTWRELQDQSRCVAQDPPLADWIADFPRRGRDVESFIYWSQEYYGAGKPVILMTHVALLRQPPDRAVVIGRQIFSSRYMNGALSLTAITTDAAGARYLIYLNRSNVDLLGGLFGGFKRSALESRLSSQVPEIILKLRTRLEGSRYATSSDPLRHE